MDPIRSTTWLVSLGLHAGILVAIVGVEAGGKALQGGDGDDIFVVEQGIAMEGVIKLGQAEETVETVEVPPVQTAELKMHDTTDVPVEEETTEELPQEVEPELTDVVMARESEHEDPIEERRPEPVTEKEEIPEEQIEERRPEPISEKEEIPEELIEEPEPIVENDEIPEGIPMEARPAQVALRMLKSSGQAQSGGDTTNRRAYLGKLRKLIEHNKVNPRSRQTGIVLISFTVAPTGELISRTIKKSSGSKVLDEAAIAALDRSAPFPPMPENTSSGPLKVQVPFKFITR